MNEAGLRGPAFAYIDDFRMNPYISTNASTALFYMFLLPNCGQKKQVLGVARVIQPTPWSSKEKSEDRRVAPLFFI